MRIDFAKTGSGLIYDIRGISDIAARIEKLGMDVVYENIGDPIAKGLPVPGWIKEVIKETLNDDMSLAYSPTKGIPEARRFLAEQTNKSGGIQITEDDVMFFNGMGDGVARLYSAIRVDARIIMPEPTYPTHFMSEVLHASFPPNTYKMNPYNGWHPDMNELERKVKSHKAITGILVINPDNPTGFVYPESTLREIVRIAKENGMFLIFDEIYENMVFNDVKTAKLCDVIGDVPGISMKSLSKEVPWPGGRCGWIEIYNAGKYPEFDRWINAVYQQKMSEVCSTTLPQMAIPKLLSNPNYAGFLANRKKHYEKLADIAYNVFKDVPYIVANRANGSFYHTVVFNDAVMNDTQSLTIENKEVRLHIEGLLKGAAVEKDKRFAYYLLGSAGICVVPLSSFFTNLQGFRMTLLENDVKKFENTIKTIAKNIVTYIETTKN